MAGPRGKLRCCANFEYYTHGDSWMSDIVKALLKLRPGAKWSLDGNSYHGITWLDDNQVKPSEQEISDELAQQLVEWQATQYRQQRAVEYPSIGDQLDALFHAGVFPAEMAARIQAVKNRFPKP